MPKLPCAVAAAKEIDPTLVVSSEKLMTPSKLVSTALVVLSYTAALMTPVVPRPTAVVALVMRM